MLIRGRRGVRRCCRRDENSDDDMVRLDRSSFSVLRLHDVDAFEFTLTSLD